MHIISRLLFKDAAEAFPNDAAALERTYRILRSGTFKTPDELRRVFPSLDNFKHEDRWWVIDIGGNNLRMLAFINFEDNRMYVKHIVTHADYDRLTKKYRER